MTLYLLECKKDGTDWKKGMRIWAHQPCKGWRVIEKRKVTTMPYLLY
jgi:hypothetical protein